MPTAYLSHPSFLLHEMGPHHPESPQRLRAIDDQLIAVRLMDLLRHITAPAASRAQLERVHTAAYLDEIERLSPAEGLVMLDPDTGMNPHTLTAARHAAGAVVQAVDLVLGEGYDSAFCAVRPPGHHAERGRAMGFCFFNNVAVGAAHALEHHRLQRIAILDFDVHHGNGTEEIFAGDERVLFCSTFQHPFYPYPDLDHAAANVIHCPLAAGAGGEAFRHAVAERWLPALERLRPQLILVSAGFDAHAADEMASLRLREEDYGWVTREILRVADRHAQGRVVSALEGGYDLNALGRSAAAHIKALLRS